jgi:tRNA(fMet)-specific endonuclease VapC
MQRGQLDPARLRDEDDDEPLAIAAITASELLHGVHRQTHAVARTRNGSSSTSWRHFRSSPSTSMSPACMRVSVPSSPRPVSVGDADLMIAATAVGWIPVATRDLRSFPKIRGLHVVRW